MPRFNSNGEWVAGIGKGIVSRGIGSGAGTVIATDAGDAHWWNGRPIYQREADGRGAFIEADGGEPVNSLGANRLRAGGSVWAAWLAGVGYRDSMGRANAAWNVADVGPGGTVAVMTNRATGIGMLLLQPDGSAVGVDNAAPDDQTVHALGAGKAIWTEQGHQVIRSVGLPAGLELLTHVGFWLRAVEINGVLWLLYQDERDRLLFHAAGDPMGFVLAQGNTFRPDATPDRVVWATHEGERPEDVVVVLSGQFPARVDVRPVKQPDKPKDPDQPKPEKTMKIRIPQRAREVVQALYDRHKDLAQGDDNQRRALTRLCAEQLAYEHPSVEVDYGEDQDAVIEQVNWGTKRADSGRPPSKDALAVRRQGALWSADCFNGTTREPSVPDEFEALPGQVFIGNGDPLDGGEVLRATNHLAAVPIDPKPDGLEARLKAAEARIAGIEAELAGAAQLNEQQWSVIREQGESITTLQNKPGGGTVDLSGYAKLGAPVTVSARLPLVGNVTARGSIDR